MNLRSINCEIATLLIASTCVASLLPVFAAVESDKTWEQLERKGTETLDRGEYWLAKPALIQAVEKARTFPRGDIRLAKSLDELGRYYTVRGVFPEAEKNLEEALDVKEEIYGRDNDLIIPAMGSMIRFYLNYGTASKAEVLTEILLALVQGKMIEPIAHKRGKMTLGPDGTLEGWAGVADIGKRDPAIEWAITCDELGSIYRIRGDYETAHRLFEAALEVKSTVLCKEHMSLANSYDSLGTVYSSQKQLRLAEPLLKDSLDMTEKILPPESPEVYSRIDKLARCLIKQGKYKEAETLYLRAQDLWNDAPSKYGEEVRAKFALGCLYADERNFAAAAPVLRQALEMAIKANGPDSINLVPYYKKYGYVQYYLGQKQEMNNMHSRADTISGDAH